MDVCENKVPGRKNGRIVRQGQDANQQRANGLALPTSSPICLEGQWLFRWAESLSQPPSKGPHFVRYRPRDVMSRLGSYRSHAMDSLTREGGIIFETQAGIDQSVF
jgi:hypothetical protein